MNWILLLSLFLQMLELRHREVKKLVQGHTARKWWSRIGILEVML